MFCPNCGNNCGDANFCSKCGCNLKGIVVTSSTKSKTAAQQMIEDANKAREYEKSKRYVPAHTIASSLEAFDDSKPSWYPGKKKDDRKEKIAELDASGQVYCPKCLSTSISGDKKGFGIGKAVIGAAAFGGIGLTAGNIGSKKAICTCLKCGYQWKAGKK